MTPHEYQVLAEKTESKPHEALLQRLMRSDETPRLVHASMGLQTEAGEFTDALKKYVYYGKELDRVNLGEEIGDILWYCALACNALGIDMGAVMEKNIAKLQARYPDKFTEEAALVRHLEVERSILEGEEPCP